MYGTMLCGQICGVVLASGVSLGEAVEAYYAAFSGVGYRLDALLVARLKAYGCCGGYVQMIAEGRLAVKFQIAVYLKEVEVRAYLYGSVARVAYCEGYGLSSLVVSYVALTKHHASCRSGLCGLKTLLGGI